MPEKSNAQKMFLKHGLSVFFHRPPPDLSDLLGPAPGFVLVSDSTTPVDFILAFIENRAGLEAALPALKQRLNPGGLLWVAYHKGTSKIETDIHRDSINTYAATLGLQGVAVISINNDWSALRLKAA